MGISVSDRWGLGYSGKTTTCKMYFWHEELKRTVKYWTSDSRIQDGISENSIQNLRWFFLDLLTSLVICVSRHIYLDFKDCDSVDFTARTYASAGRLKTMTCRASPCRTSVIVWIGIAAPLTGSWRHLNCRYYLGSHEDVLGSEACWMVTARLRVVGSKTHSWDRARWCRSQSDPVGNFSNLYGGDEMLMTKEFYYKGLSCLHPSFLFTSQTVDGLHVVYKITTKKSTM